MKPTEKNNRYWRNNFLAHNNNNDLTAKLKNKNEDFCWHLGIIEETFINFKYIDTSDYLKRLTKNIMDAHIQAMKDELSEIFDLLIDDRDEFFYPKETIKKYIFLAITLAIAYKRHDLLKKLIKKENFDINFVDKTDVHVISSDRSGNCEREPFTILEVAQYFDNKKAERILKEFINKKED